MGKTQPTIKLTNKDLELIQTVIRTYPAPSNLHQDLLNLYDRITSHLQR